MRTYTVFAAGLLTWVGTASAQSEGLSEASAISLTPSVAMTEIIGASATAGGRLVITGLHASGTATVVTLQAAGTGISATVEVGAGLVGELSLSVGQTVVVSTEAAGELLMVGGRALAFIPNEVACGLIHHREFRR